VFIDEVIFGLIQHRLRRVDSGIPSDDRGILGV
jgi:hypothetical protein